MSPGSAWDSSVQTEMSSSIALPELSTDCLFELTLRHFRSPFDTAVPCLFVKLVASPPSGSSVRTQAAPPAGGNIVDRGPAGHPGLAGSCPILVDSTCRYLFCRPFRHTPVLLGIPYVFVLPFPLWAPRSLWHLHILVPGLAVSKCPRRRVATRSPVGSARPAVFVPRFGPGQINPGLCGSTQVYAGLRGSPARSPV
jgi:hypothetical protein